MSGMIRAGLRDARSPQSLRAILCAHPSRRRLMDWTMALAFLVRRAGCPLRARWLMGRVLPRGPLQVHEATQVAELCFELRTLLPSLQALPGGYPWVRRRIERALADAYPPGWAWAAGSPPAPAVASHRLPPLQVRSMRPAVCPTEGGAHPDHRF